MALLPILQYPDPRLRVVGQTVERFDEHVKQMVDDMFETLYASQNCAALAATQLGLPWRITVIDISEDKSQPLCLINPEISEESGKQTSMEGCMSIENVYEKVTRPQKFKVTYQDVQGQVHTLEAEGFLAKCIEHEVDHLKGILFVERLNAAKRLLVQLKLNKRFHRL